MSALPASPTWSLDGLRLPKAIENDAPGPALHAALRERCQKLWAGGAIVVPTAAWSPAVATALDRAKQQGHVVRGLERIEKALARQARGLAIADARSATERGSRVSRLVLLSNDGTERFYRQAERLLGTQGQRLLAIRVDADATQLAGVVPEASGVVRALMLEHKDSVVSVLLALYASPSEP
ncbi:MAG: hypothetical protein ABI895_11555 [Deltaproteobacteria bacterium]